MQMGRRLTVVPARAARVGYARVAGTGFTSDTRWMTLTFARLYRVHSAAAYIGYESRIHMLGDGSHGEASRAHVSLCSDEAGEDELDGEESEREHCACLSRVDPWASRGAAGESERVRWRERRWSGDGSALSRCVKRGPTLSGTAGAIRLACPCAPPVNVLSSNHHRLGR